MHLIYFLAQFSCILYQKCIFSVFGSFYHGLYIIRSVQCIIFHAKALYKFGPSIPYVYKLRLMETGYIDELACQYVFSIYIYILIVCIFIQKPCSFNFKNKHRRLSISSSLCCNLVHPSILKECWRPTPCCYLESGRYTVHVWNRLERNIWV